MCPVAEKRQGRQCCEVASLEQREPAEWAGRWAAEAAAESKTSLAGAVVAVGVSESEVGAEGRSRREGMGRTSAEYADFAAFPLHCAGAFGARDGAEEEGHSQTWGARKGRERVREDARDAHLHQRRRTKRTS